MSQSQAKSIMHFGLSVLMHLALKEMLGERSAGHFYYDKIDRAIRDWRH